MGKAVIKSEHKDVFVGFGKGGSKKLGERDDLDELAIIAHESGNPALLDLFETLPPLAELKKAQTDAKLKAVPPASNQAPAQQDAGNPELAKSGPVRSEIVQQPEALTSNTQPSKDQPGK